VVALNRRERRALREIEEELTAEDPALAVLLRRSGLSRRDWILRRVARAAIVVAAPLIVLGLFLSDAALLTSGLLMLVVLPPTLWLVALLLGDGNDDG
jgi:hypothetical protein